MERFKKIARRVKLLEVTPLDLSLTERGQFCELSHLLVYPKALMSIMPSLRELELSNTHYLPASVCKDIAKKCTSLEKLTWNNHNLGLDTCGGLLENCRNLTELYMDDSGLCNPYRPIGFPSELFALVSGCTLFHHCSSKLERVFIKNASDYDYAVRPDTGCWADKQQLSQGALIVCALKPQSTLVSKRLSSRDRDDAVRPDTGCWADK